MVQSAVSQGISEPISANQLRKGALGPAAIAFFVISAAGPLVAMAGGVPVAMLFGNGPGIPTMFVAAMVILWVFSAGYTAMAREVRNAGAFYAFAARGLGGISAGATGMIALLSYNAIQIGLYGLFGAAAKGALDDIVGPAVPWWGYSGIALLSIAALGYRQVDLSAKILGLLVAGEYLVVLILDIAIIAWGGDKGLDIKPFTPSVVASGSPAIGLMLCFAAFIGFEATTIYSEEARDPERTIPRATYLSVIVIGGFYALSTWVVVEGVGADRLLQTLASYTDPTLYLFDLADRYVGHGLSTTMRILFVTSAYASLLAFHNAIARYLYAMGRERILPSALGCTHPRFSSPHIGSVTQSIFALLALLAFAVAGADPIFDVFTLLSAIATLGIVVLMAITSLATFCFFAGRAEDVLKTRILPLVALVGFVGVAGLAAFRFDVLAGTSQGAAQLLTLSIPLAAAIGAALAARLRKSDPQGFSQLGQAAD